MIYRIYNKKDIDKIEQFLKQECIEYEKSTHIYEIFLKDDIENVIDCFDEYEDIDKEILDKASEYTKKMMWNEYEWSEYNLALRDYINEGIEKYSK